MKGLKGLKGINFNERSSVENMIDELTTLAADPYAASLPLMGSASLGDVKQVTQALENSLLRIATSNDYPAWALAKVRLAAAVMRDKELYQEINNPLLSSIEAAKLADAKAEYILAVLNNALARLVR